MNSKILVIIALLLPDCIIAQGDSLLGRPQLHLVSKYTDAGTHLRWGYADADSWYEHYRRGVILERRRVTPNPTSYQAIHLGQILPETELENLAVKTGDEMLGVILGMGYQNWEDSRYVEGEDDFADKRANFENRYAFYHFAADRSREAALAAGLGYTDTDIAEGVTYAYRLRAQRGGLVGAVKVVPPVVRQNRPIFYDLLEEESAVTLRWERALHNRYFSAYWIERSEIEKDNWQRLTEVPYVQGYDPESINEKGPKFFTFRDSIGRDTRFRYRLKGIDAFGDLSPPSPMVYGRGRDRTPPPQPQLRSNETDLLHLRKRLSWTQPAGEAVTSYHLERQFDGGSSVVIDFASPGDTTMLDTLSESGVYRYRLIAQDAAGNLAYSPPIFTKVHDREAPRKPEGLTAETDTSGRITLTWDAAKDKDVVGYYLYVADGTDRTYRRLTNQVWPYRRFVDSVSMSLLNRYRYYYVVAVDKDILYSEDSDTLKVLRPDVNPPAPAHVSDFHVRKEGIHLNFRHSNSRDVVRHQLLRRSRNEPELSVLKEWKRPPFNYVDTTVLADETYFYAYRAVDATGLFGKVVSEVQVQAKRKVLDAPELMASREDRRVTLSWELREEAAAWQLYRSVNGGPEQRISTLTGEKLTYVDGRTKPGQTIAYRLRLLRQDGRRSPFSEPVEISL